MFQCAGQKNNEKYINLLSVIQFAEFSKINLVMCGIAGILNFDGSRVKDVDLSLMCDSIRHRGPDDEGSFVQGNVGIGMRRLSIIGVEGGRQPISNEDDTIQIVFNGEIYNYISLREELIRRGHRFRSRTDTECILHLYEDYGVDCLEHLRGMFAFAIFDTRDNSLFVARDRIGIKPLYYYLDTKRLVFGSEIKAILSCPGIERSIDYDGLDAFFSYSFIPNPKTIFRNISKLEPGFYLVCRGNNVAVKKYWDLFFHPDNERSEVQFSEEFVHRFEETIKIHLMSEVPLGAFLSGGVDSSLVTAFMSMGSTSPVNTFTIAFGGKTGGYFDERIYARKIADRYKARYNEFEVQPDLQGILDSVVTSFDEPFADDSVVPTFHICRLASESVTVALTGLGGDELFGGYERYVGLLLSKWVSRIANIPGIAKAIDCLPEPKSGGELISRLKRFARSQGTDPALVYRGIISNMPKDGRRLMYAGDISRGVDYEYVDDLCTRYFRMGNASDPLDKALYQDIKTYLPEDILALNDRIGMHHSMELRVPFVDHTLMEFCAGIPNRLKIRKLEKKYLLKKMAGRYVPPDVLSHPKQGFGSPMTSWLREDLKPFVLENLSEERLKIHNLFNISYVQSMLQEHMGRRQNHYKQIFALLMFQRWYEKYMV